MRCCPCCTPGTDRPLAPPWPSSTIEQKRASETDEVRHLLRAPAAQAVGPRGGVAHRPGGARAGRARRPARLRLRLGGRAPLPRGIFPLLGAGGVPRGLRGADQDHPRRPRHPPGDPQLQPPGAHRREAWRRSTSSPTAGSISASARARRGWSCGGFDIPAKEKRAMALEAAEQIANMMVMDPYPGFEGKGFSLPVPQRGAQAGAEAASADVDGLHQPRHHQGRGLATASARWPSPSSIRRRRATGPTIYYGIIKSRGVRAARPRA